MIRAVLHRACRLARRWRGNSLPNHSVTPSCRPGKSTSVAGPDAAPSAEEVRALIAAEGEDLRVDAFIRLPAATGSRRDEAGAVRWDGPDVNAATLRVDEAVVAARRGAVVRGPKTRALVRTVDLTSNPWTAWFC